MERLLLEARIIFPNVVAAREGMVVQLSQSDAPAELTLGAAR